ncbi:hypothetical protein ABIB85_003437 [Bradyrhizobium sp. JR1.5]
MERASSHALACSGEEWAEWGERWANTTAGRLFKSGFEKPVHDDSRRVAESGAWCNDLGVRCNTGELR